MIFTYWQGDRAHLADFLADWRSAGHDVLIFDDQEVEGLLSEAYPSAFLALYRHLRIPACRSDLARIVLLERHGGLYVDAHTGTGHAEALGRLFQMLQARELILFDNANEHAFPDDTYLLNGAILARAGCRVLRLIANRAFDNLSRHHAAEARSSGHEEYNIFAMTGGWNILATLFDISARPFVLRPAYQAEVHLEVLEGEVGEWPFRWYRHYHYREAGRHWSERQKTERLFDDT